MKINPEQVLPFAIYGISSILVIVRCTEFKLLLTGVLYLIFLQAHIISISVRSINNNCPIFFDILVLTTVILIVLFLVKTIFKSAAHK